MRLKNPVEMIKYAKTGALLAGILQFVACSEETDMENGSYRKLSPEEERVIVHKGTEPPFSGKYWNFFEKGFYHCKRCNAMLYTWEDKFDSRCGWPSFDGEIEGAIKRQKDPDGERTEILCANCGAHLGHVFEGEGLTEKNVRHCVNSLSLTFVPLEEEPNIGTAYFAGGCFWGVEYFFEHKKGVISAVSGYMGGKPANPTYHDVCLGNTGHLEVVEVIFDTTKVDYEELARFFFEIHDPTQAGGQGPDMGEQYSSAIFYKDEKQKEIALKLIKILEDKGYKVVTKVLPAGTFWRAEDYHQDYYDKKKGVPYCHRYKRKF